MDERRTTRDSSASRNPEGIPGIAVALSLIALTLFLMLGHTALAAQFYSGATYSFTTEPPPSGLSYTYHWSASDGSSADYTNRVFNWSAPTVDAPKNVAINVTVTAAGGCSATHDMEITVLPKPAGQISLEMSLDGNQEDVRLGAVIDYTINVTNTGQTAVVSIPIEDDYPEKFLQPVSADRPWSADNSSILLWNNLLDSPLAPGQSVKVSLRFSVIGITDRSVTNQVQAKDVKDDSGSTLEPQKASSIIAGIKYQCPTLGPSTVCNGEAVPFSAPQGFESYSWVARVAKDTSGSFVGVFDDPTRADVNWTAPGPGTYEISFNNFVCKQTITVKQCNSSIRIIKDCEHRSPVRIGNTVTYVYNVTNTGDLSLREVAVTDVMDWGPELVPKYVRGDNGNNVLDPSETWRYEGVYRIPNPLDYKHPTTATLKNVATVTAKDPRGAAVSDIATYLLEIERPLPELGIEMKAEPDPVKAGKTLTYTISYQNFGNETAHGVTITESYDKNLTYVSSNPLLAEGSNNVWSLGDLAKGVAGAITVNVNVDPSAQNGALLKNTVIISCAENIKANASVSTAVLGPLSSIRISKNCEHKTPVRVGDTVTYVYNVTNTGDLPLKDVVVTDEFTDPKGVPGVVPKYVRGDDGNNVLDPSETWMYEGVYRIPDPLDYQSLSIMSIQSETSQQGTIIQKLMNSRARLEIMLNKLKLLRSGFNKTLARRTVGNIEIQGVYYLTYNYTGRLAGEALIETLDHSGAVKSSMYIDPISGSSLTTEYGNKGQAVSDSYDSSLTRESLVMEYDKPSKGYMTCTIIDHSNGDSLIILVLDSNGTVLSKQYRKTPGEKIYKATLKNVATVTATDSRGAAVSDITAYLLEIERPLPELGIAKKAEPEPVYAGKTLTYTISYQNLGNETAHAVTITDSYDKNLTYVSSYPLPADGSNNIWSIGDLAKGVTGAITVNVKVDPSVQNGTRLRNTAMISCSENIRANASVDTTVLGSQPLLQINKTASKNLISNNTEFYYIITYKNIGRINATNVSIDDIVDPNLDFESSIPEPSTNTLGDHHPIWNSTRLKATNLSPGESGTIVMRVQAKYSIPESIKRVYNLYRISYNGTQGTYKSLEIPVIHSLFVIKTVERSTYSPGELVNYTITYGNKGDQEATAENVNITDDLPDVQFVGASPMPNLIQGKTLVWNKNLIFQGNLPSGTNGSIALTVGIKERPNIRYDETGSVSGEGYVYNRKMLSTNMEPYSLINKVTINSTTRAFKPDYDSVTVGVSDPGTEIDSVEHGSGYYQQEQLVCYNRSNRSIRLDEQIFAKHAPTSLSLSRNRELNFNSLWFDRTTAKNYVRNETVSENYLYMDIIDKKSTFLVDPNQTVYRSSGDFYGGEAQISYTKTKPRPIPGLSDNYVDISEDYHGSFKVGQSLDSYGSGVSYSKSAKGEGFVASDKRIGKSQRSFEAGSGSYQSDEVIKTGVVYKDTAMTYAPSNLTAGGYRTNYSSKWHEEMRTSNRDIGAVVSERISSADSIKKETLMQDATMALLAQFNGTANIKAVQQIGPKKKENLSIDQTFIGSYKLDTTIAINEGPKYLRPHINVTKEVLKQDDHTALFRINLTNDGNKTLGPVYVTDRLPEGLTFINSSLRPDITGKEIRWSLPMLQIGGKQSITLRASIKDTGAQFVNLVEVSAQYSGGVVVARAACGFVLDWLQCCLTKQPIIRLHESIPPSAIYAGGSWVPPQSFNLGLNQSEYPLYQEIPCSSCSADIPENGGCSSCP